MYVSRRIVFLFLSACLIFSACNKNDDQDAILVEVGDKKLTLNQLMEVIPDNSDATDSTALADRYIQEWIMEQLIVSKAEESLPEDKKDFTQLIENYRKSLLTYAYEQEWVSQKLDTIVTDDEIEKYYNDNDKNFQLKGYIVKVKFCAVAAGSKAYPQLKKLFYSIKPEDHVKWEQMCVDIGASYYFNEDHWLLWEEFMKQVPLEVYDIEAFLKNKKTIEFEKDNNQYLLTITDYQLNGSRSPLSFETDRIRSMIINRRKLELLDTMRRDLYARAQQENMVKTHYNKK